MGNCLFLRARGWGIDRQVRKKLQIPGGVPGGMVTGRIEPCITDNNPGEGSRKIRKLSSLFLSLIPVWTRVAVERTPLLYDYY